MDKELFDKLKRSNQSHQSHTHYYKNFEKGPKTDIPNLNFGKLDQGVLLTLVGTMAMIVIINLSGVVDLNKTSINKRQTVNGVAEQHYTTHENSKLLKLQNKIRTQSYSD